MRSSGDEAPTMHVVPPLYAQRLKTWEQWAGVAAQADGGGKV